jgi:uncharacterized protein YjbI with pentapeptide repeats
VDENPNREVTSVKAERPKFTKDPMYQMLRVDDTQGFNLKREQGGVCDLRGVDLRGLDLRGLDASGLDFTGSYFRDTDLRGIDFSQAVLEGCSFYGAKVSGAYFPPELPADEIRLSVELGTRVRYRR